MIAIILAAGTGYRLGARATTTPKPCIEVGGRPLLGCAIDFAIAAGAADAVVVTGHLREQTESVAREHGAEVVFNERFASAGNIISLQTARARAAGDVLLMNSDHLYRPTLSAVVAAAAKGATQVTAFIDHDRTLGADDMKVRLDGDRRVVAIDKQLESWDAGYVGMTFIPAARLAEYFYTADNVQLERGDGVHVEAILQRMAGVDPAHTCNVSGHGWYEVDDEADLARAEAALAGSPWYPAPRS